MPLTTELLDDCVTLELLLPDGDGSESANSEPPPFNVLVGKFGFTISESEQPPDDETQVRALTVKDQAAALAALPCVPRPEAPPVSDGIQPTKRRVAAPKKVPAMVPRGADCIEFAAQGAASGAERLASGGMSLHQIAPKTRKTKTPELPTKSEVPASLLSRLARKRTLWIKNLSGEGEIRTPGTLRYAGFQDRDRFRRKHNHRMQLRQFTDPRWGAFWGADVSL